MSRTWIVLDALSPREHFVCQGLVQGLAYKEIAGVLDITANTARGLAKHAMKKLGVSEWQALLRVYSLAREIEALAPARARVKSPIYGRKDA